MKAQITSKQIRRNFSKHYDASYDNIARFEDEEYGKALIASAEFRKIADEMRRQGLEIEQVRQIRDILDPFISCTSRQIGDFYIRTPNRLGFETFKGISSLTEYKVYSGSEVDEKGKQYGYFWLSKNEHNPKENIIRIFENKQPPVEGIKKLLKTLADRITDPFVIGGDNSVRIA